MKKLLVLFIMIFALSSTSCSVLNKEKEETEETSGQRSKSKRKKNKDRTEEEETGKMEETSETEETTQETIQETRVAQMQTISSTEAQAQQNTQIYTTMYVVNCNESITLRTSPSTKASEIRQIPLGAAVSYIETSENGFYKVSYMGDTGYALAQYLNTENISNTADMLPYPILNVVNCKKSITLRTSPSTKASEIRQIPLGAAVSYIETSENGFYKVSYMGDTGYALAQYLSTENVSNSANMLPYPILYVVNCKESITLRTSPSTKASAIRQIPLGAAVSYIEISENGFYKVSYMGDTGYALAQYLSTENVSNSANMLPYPILYVVNCKESITLRTSPSTKASAIRQIPLGAAVSYIETSENGFYKVSYMGDTGYALSQYLSSYESDEPPALGEEYIFRDGVVVNCKTSITLRESASTSAKEITQIPLDSLVIVYEKTGNGFYYVGYAEDGDLSSEDLLYGYVLEGYILLLERN